MKGLLDLTDRFETRFLSPALPDSDFSFHKSLQADHAGVFPQSVIHQLDEWGGSKYYVPAEQGGRLSQAQELFQYLRLLARRDLTVAIAHCVTILGSITIWMAGTPIQKKTLATEIMSGGPVALGLTERAHGSDLVATACLATQSDGSYTLNGEKYLINNATRCTWMTVLARTATRDNARDLSLFLVSKAELGDGEYHEQPKIPTHGVKGADISGISFTDAKISEAALIGKQGQGLEIMLRGLQLTRTFCTALSSGVLDTALRMAADFAWRRRVYGKTLWDLPAIKHILARATADALIVELVSLFSHRAINVFPEQMSLVSSIAKASVCSRAEQAIEDLPDVLGARSYLEDDGPYGSFGKVRRDARLISIFDGSTVVNLHTLVQQLPKLAKLRRRGPSPDSNDSTIGTLFSIEKDGEALDFSRFRLMNSDRDHIIDTLCGVADQIRQLDGISSSVAQHLQGAVVTLKARLSSVDSWMLEHALTTRHASKLHFDQAAQYCRIFCAAICLQAFLWSRRAMHAACQDGLWLTLCLDRLLDIDSENVEPLLDILALTVNEGRMISVFSIPLAESLQGVA